jgi:hypothetical protein
MNITVNLDSMREAIGTVVSDGYYEYVVVDYSLLLPLRSELSRVHRLLPRVISLVGMVTLAILTFEWHTD